MRLVVQRVKSANVSVNNEVISSINKGFLVYLGIHVDDKKDDIDYYVNKLLNIRIFNDSNDKMNLNIKKVKGSILLISQFTLYGNAKKGNRPSFIEAAKHDQAEVIYEAFVNKLNNEITTKAGIFGANMEVSSINDGPVTIII